MSNAAEAFLAQSLKIPAHKSTSQLFCVEKMTTPHFRGLSLVHIRNQTVEHRLTEALVGLHLGLGLDGRWGT